MERHVNEQFNALRRDYRGGNRERLKQQRQIKKTLLIIRAEQCLRTEGEVYTEEYKRLRKHMSDKKILEKYEVLKESLGLTLVITKGDVR